jgi:hypothetical protein
VFGEAGETQRFPPGIPGFPKEPGKTRTKLGGIRNDPEEPGMTIINDPELILKWFERLA